MTLTAEPPRTIDAPATTPEAADRARRFCVEAARLCSDLKCDNVRVLDVTGKSPVCDFFLLATGSSPRQLRSVAKRVDELADEHDLPSLNSVKRAEGGDRWTALDLVDVVVHLFDDEARDFYDLDGLWSDATEVRWHRDS